MSLLSCYAVYFSLSLIMPALCSFPALGRGTRRINQNSSLITFCRGHRNGGSKNPLEFLSLSFLPPARVSFLFTSFRVRQLLSAIFPAVISFQIAPIVFLLCPIMSQQTLRCTFLTGEDCICSCSQPIKIQTMIEGLH
jgi:hypothetical protein